MKLLTDMPYGLLYDTPLNGLCIVLYEQPKGGSFSVAAWDTMREVQDEFKTTEERLSSATKEKKIELFSMLVFLSPLIIRLDTHEALFPHIDTESNYVCVVNPFKLPKFLNPVKETIRATVVLDMYSLLVDKYGKGINVNDRS
jgi:hypothetical protein